MTTNHVDVWDTCLRAIESEVSSKEYEDWFLPIKPLQLKGQVLTIQVASHFFFEHLEKHHLSLLRSAIYGSLGTNGKLEYSISMDSTRNGDGTFTIPSGSDVNSGEAPRSEYSSNSGHARLPRPFVIPGLQKVKIESRLNSGYNFDNFIEGDCNRLARSAGISIAGRPGGTAFNPLFVHSAVGLGKTHLLQAIGNEVLKRFPKMNVLYIPSQEFAEEYGYAVKKGTVKDFLDFYRMIDVLLIDDIQFISGKEKTQDNFYGIFNHLKDAGKQIILASDQAPGEMVGFADRLLSRFKWGLTAVLYAPDQETRKQILKSKIYRLGLELPEPIVEYVAAHVSENVRELEGAIVGLLAHSNINKGGDLDMKLVKEVVDRFSAQMDREITIDSIQQVVGEQMDVEVEEMKAKTRKRQIVQARQIAMYFAKELTRHSLKTIGSHFGGRDHSTVIHALKTVEDLMSTDKVFKQNVDAINTKLGGKD